MNLADRMKLYEQAIEPSLLPRLPILARLDGKCFHAWCHGLQRPFDQGFVSLMDLTCARLVEETSARCGYAQSDEITLLWQAENPDQQLFMGSRHSKMVSVLASICTSFFAEAVPRLLPAKTATPARFDCRVWNVPDRTEAANCFVWRELDAARNSVSMVAQTHFSHNSLQHLSSAQMQERLWQEKGINWNDLPARFKRGGYVLRRVVTRAFEASEIELLPPLHEARRNPDLVVERSLIDHVELPRLTTIINREAVLFDGAEPLVADTEAEG